MTTAAQLQDLARTDPDTLARAFTATLVDFGYRIDQAHVAQYIASYLAGEKPKGGPAAFVYDWLTKGIEEEGGQP
mgnify:CR=1 FL=1